MSRWEGFRAAVCISRPVYRPPDALLPEYCQAFAVHIQVHQGEVRAQPVMVLRKPWYRTLSKPKTRFRMRNGCSTFARTLDLLGLLFL